jgi:hypothetical protein
MAAIDTLKDYLVALGFAVDQTQFDRMARSIADMDSRVKLATGSMAANYAKAATTVVGTIASITAATVGLLDRVSQADLGYQKLALRMYMNVDAAKRMKIATDALGESIEDIAYIPELRERYFRLIDEQRILERGFGEPGNYEKDMRYLRDIRFEFQRLKVESVYAMQHIGSQILRNLRSPIGDVHQAFSKFNDWIRDHMPEWTEKVSGWLTTIVDIGPKVIQFLKDFKIFFAPIAAYFALGSPMGRAITVITIMLALIQDFYRYLNGERSSKTLGPIWDELIKTLNIIEALLGKIDGWVQSSGGWWKFLFGPDLDGSTRRRGGATPQTNSSGGLKERLFNWLGTDGTKGPWQRKQPASGKGIAGQESGGDYGATNPQSGAYGKYQIMPQNWPQWSKEAGLGANAPMTPTNQEIVYAHRMGLYVAKYAGDMRLAAAAWYAGESRVDRLWAGDMSVLNIRPRNGLAGPNVGDYIYQTTGQRWTGDVNVSVGDVNVTVGGSSASPSDVGQAVKDVLLDEFGKAITIQIRDLSGVFGG